VQNHSEDLYYNAAVLALALASMLDRLLASTAADSAQPVCSSFAYVQLSEPKGLFHLRVAACVHISRFQVVQLGNRLKLISCGSDITTNLGCDLQAEP